MDKNEKLKNMIDSLVAIADDLVEMKETIEITEADGCKGCAFDSTNEWEMPCVKCKRNCKDYWRKMESEE
jgi:hypothetical protein